jgi:hypothetical protein
MEAQDPGMPQMPRDPLSEGTVILEKHNEVLQQHWFFLQKFREHGSSNVVELCVSQLDTMIQVTQECRADLVGFFSKKWCARC